MRRVTYEGGASFVPVCKECGRFVKADATIETSESGLSPKPNATCTIHGRIQMLFEGFVEEE